MKYTQNKETFVKLIKSITIDHEVFRKGQSFALVSTKTDGVEVYSGAGCFPRFPYDAIGTYTDKWDEVNVTKNGNTETTTITKRTADVTTQYNDKRDKFLAARNQQLTRSAQHDRKGRIADLRKTIKFVKSGNAEQELNELIELAKNNS